MSFIKDEIPEMTHPFGKHWPQPDTSEITFHMKQAHMSPETLEKLQKYNCSLPSGVYVGKMWKSRQSDGSWVLRWYAESDDPERCRIEQRKIIINRKRV